MTITSPYDRRADETSAEYVHRRNAMDTREPCSNCTSPWWQCIGGATHGLMCCTKCTTIEGNHAPR